VSIRLISINATDKLKLSFLELSLNNRDVYVCKMVTSIDIHISIETFVRIQLEHSLYEHDLSMNRADNELVLEPFVAFVRDRTRHAKLKR
jgi:hypothetical protein